ncbi:MAG: pyruvate dehydrogenase (acetyl-transferring) E1 component subunit alpha [Phycisphaeraceae bacterium]|nr:pyruvate dehydrogenase (acetyl-transferring) E1 component subunit alpha [Phycisphaeraceae bacterium]
MSQVASKPASRPSGERLSARLPDATLRQWLFDMQLIREFETRCMQAYQQAKIGGFCHIYIGQEACAVGTIGCLQKDDPVITAYRDHGHALARGMSARACMAEMFGKLAGCAKGKGGSMHMFDKPNALYGGHGIVGAQTPLGAGLAFATRYEWEVLGTGTKKVTLCYLGDGAIDQGAFHEALNLASLFGLPVIYVIENNGYSMGTAIHRHTANHERLTMRGESYGIKSIEIDGFDILNVYDQFKPLVDECRDLQRPGFVDLKTYRYQGHSMSDPQKYRTKEEVEQWKERDSIASLLHHLMNDRKAVTEDDWKAMQKEIADIVRDSVEFSEAAEPPDVDKELYADVLVNPQPNMSPMGDYVHGARNPLLP